MRASLFRPALGVALVAAAVLAGGASAAPNTLVLEDAKGDANLVNGQGFANGVGDRSGPVQKADSDIIAATLASTGTTKKVKGKSVFTCTGFTATIELAAPPAANTLYRIQGNGVANASMFWLQYSTAPTGTRTTIRHTNDADTTTEIPAVKIDGNKVIFTITEKELKATGEKLDKFVMSNLGVDVRLASGVLTAPLWDSIDRSEDKSFSPCK
jgi:hypothetical protein